MNMCRVVAIASLALLSLSGCEQPAPEPLESPTPTASTSAPVTSPSTPADPAPRPVSATPPAGDEPLVAFAPGATLAETQAVIERGVASGSLRVESASTEARELRGTSVNVTEQVLAMARGPVARVRLVYFGGRLVSVVQTFHAPRPELVDELTAAHGEPTVKAPWTGWWNPTADVVAQLGEGGLVYEVFDLSTALDVVPDIRRVMLDSWMARYESPPPWAFANAP